MVMRGGTSKGAYFVADDLPTDQASRDEVLLRIMGSPDARQIDGIGGAHPLTSKVAIVGASAGGEADVDYLFLQIGVDEPTVSDRQNCGNLLAGVGPFAIERGLVNCVGDVAELRIRMLNTGSIATATFSLRAGMPRYDGDASISGVPGSASPVFLDFESTAGSTCGALLPTGNVVDVLGVVEGIDGVEVVDGVEGIEVTCVDNGMPCVVLRAKDLGIAGDESCAELEANQRLSGKLERIRIQAGTLMGLGDVSGATIPKMTMVSAPRSGGSICTRTFIPHRCHEAIGVLGAVSVATALRLPGSVGSEFLDEASDPAVTEIEHPTGTFAARVEVAAGSEGFVVGRSGIVRTTRKLMDGTVFS